MWPLEEDMLPHSPRPLHPVTWAKDGHSSKSGPLPTPAPACQVVGEQQAVRDQNQSQEPPGAEQPTAPQCRREGSDRTPMQEGGLRSSAGGVREPAPESGMKSGHPSHRVHSTRQWRREAG